MSAINYILFSELAGREGADDRGRQVAGILGYMNGLTPLSLVTTVMLARRDAETRTSNGAGRVAVPAAAGTTPDQAAETLKAAGFTVSTTTINEASTSVPADHVIRTQPAAGTLAAPGSAVILVISSGPSPTPPA